MIYTKKQILDAFCEATNYKPESGTKQEHLVRWEAQREKVYQIQLANLKTPREQAKEIGLNKLLEVEKELNKDVTL
jgi:flagellar basal body rod protein FlgB